MASLGTNRLNIVNDQPSVEKLWNDRYRLEFYCDNDGKKTDWYYTNVGNILPDFGTLQGDGFGENPSESIPASKYADMRLIEVGTEYVPAANQHYVKLTYETLTAAWVLEKDEDTDYELNGLKRITRTSVALPDTAYTNVVGTSTITSDATTLYLGSYKIEETDAKWMLTEVWLEAGTLSETTDFVGSQQSKVIETIGADPATPSGYLLASKQESNFEGFQTNRFTFLKPSVLSIRQEFIGGATTVQVSAFGLTEVQVDAALSEVTSSHVLISQSESDYEGIKTSTFEYQLDESFTEDYELNGLKRISLIELGTAAFSAQTIGGVSATAPTTGLYLGQQDIDNGGVIKVRKSTWMEAGILSKSERQGPSEIPNTKEHIWESIGTVPSMPGIIIEKTKSDILGFITYRYVSISTLADGDPTIGTLSSTNETIDVRVPGEVDMFTVTIAGNAAGATVYATQKPPTVGKFQAQVDVSITSSASSDNPVAYNLNGIYSSMTDIVVTNSPTRVKNSGSGVLYSTQISVNQTPLPYYVRSASKWPSDPSALVATVTTTSLQDNNDTFYTQSISKTINLSGSVDTDISTTGIYDSNVVPIFQDLDGVQYYRKTNYTLS